MVVTIDQKLQKLRNIYPKSSTHNNNIHTLLDQLSQVLTLCNLYNRNPKCLSIPVVSDALTKIMTLQQTRTDKNQELLLGEQLTSAILVVLNELKTQQIKWLKQIKKYLTILNTPSSPLENPALRIYDYVDLRKIIKDPKQFLKKQREKPATLRQISRILHDQSLNNQAKVSSLSTLLSIDELMAKDTIKAKILTYIQQPVEPPPTTDLIDQIDRVISILEKSELLSFSGVSIHEIVRIMPQLQKIHGILFELAKSKQEYKKRNISFPMTLYIDNIKALPQLLEQYLPVLYEMSDNIIVPSEWFKTTLLELQKTPPLKFDDVNAQLSRIYFIFKKKTKKKSSQTQVFNLLERIEGLFRCLIQDIPNHNIGIHPPFYYYLLLEQDSWWSTEDAKKQVKKKLTESIDLLLRWIEDPSSIPPPNDDDPSFLNYLPLVLLVVLCL
jgi:hypothetical protein